MISQLSASLVLIGLVIQVATLVPLRKLIAILPVGALRKKWLIMSGLIFIFIAGYFNYIVVFWGQQSEWCELIIPGIFLFGAMFVWLTIALSLQTAANLRRIEEELVHKEKLAMLGQVAMAIEESERKYRTILDVAVDGVLLMDVQTGKFISANHAICTMLGYEPEELYQLGMEDIHPLDALPEVLRKFERQLKGEIRVAEDQPVKRKDGSVFLADVSSVPMMLSGQTHMVGFFHDVTERKQMELKLQESEQRFRNITELTSDWVWQVDEHGTYVYSGTKVRDLLGYTPKEVYGKTPFDFMPPEEAARVAEIFKNIASNQIPFSYLENINLHKDGHKVILETSGIPLFNDKGVYQGYFGTEHDITERKQAEQALEESERKFRAILDSAVDGILMADAQTHKFVSANRAICDMLGYRPEELYRLGLEDIHPAESLDYVRQQFERQLKGEIRIALNLPVKRKDGSLFFADVSSAPLILAQKHYLVGIFHDVTERSKAEEKIRKLNEELEEKVKERTQQLLSVQEELVRKEKLSVLGQVAGSVGHELRNPLGVMSNAVYFLQTVLPDADESVKEYLEIIKSEITGSERIVSDLLDSVRTKQPQQEAVALADLIEQTLRKLEIPSSVTLNLEIPATLPPLWVDPQQIHQVFRNLISNGVEAMPDGGMLEIRAVLDEAANTITLTVRDSGIGMTPENLGHLFQPLFTTKARGIGLGLIVVKNLTEANAGTVEVQSEEGKGTVFTLTLPSEDKTKGVV